MDVQRPARSHQGCPCRDGISLDYKKKVHRFKIYFVRKNKNLLDA